MGKNYDNWGRLVEAVVKREQLRSLSLADSRTPSIRSLDSDSDTDYSFITSTSYQQNLSFRTTPSPLHPQLKPGKKQSGRIARTRNVVWKGLSIFRGFSSKKGNEREERQLQWAKGHTTLHQMDNNSFSTKQNSEVDFQTKEMWKRNAEITRLRELHTLKGHIEALAKAKGLDLDSVHHYYTV